MSERHLPIIGHWPCHVCLTPVPRKMHPWTDPVHCSDSCRGVAYEQRRNGRKVGPRLARRRALNVYARELEAAQAAMIALAARHGLRYTEET